MRALSPSRSLKGSQCLTFLLLAIMTLLCSPTWRGTWGSRVPLPIHSSRPPVVPRAMAGVVGLLAFYVQG